MEPSALTRPVRLRRLLFCVVSVVALSCSFACVLVGARAAVSTVMTAYVAEGDFAFGLTFADGTQVGEQDMPGTVIPPGVYQINVSDTTTEGNFDLAGNGVDLSTGIEQTEQVTWAVTFLPCSLYSYRNDQQPGGIEWFQTSAAPSSSAPCGPTALVIPVAPAIPTTPQPPITVSHAPVPNETKLSAIGTVISSTPFRGTLDCSIGSRGSLALTFRERPAKTLLAGRYEISVNDRAPGWGLLLRKPDGRRVTVTKTRFVGHRETSLVLSGGTWSAATTGSQAAEQFFTVR